MGILERLFGYQGDPAAANLTPEQQANLSSDNIRNLGLSFLKSSNTQQGRAPGIGDVLGGALPAYFGAKDQGLVNFIQKQQMLGEINQKQKLQQMQQELVGSEQLANDPVGQLLAVTNPGVLGQYLGAQRKNTEPQTIRVGDTIVSVDPVTNEVKPLYTAPIAPAEQARLAIQQKQLALAEKRLASEGVGTPNELSPQAKIAQPLINRANMKQIDDIGKAANRLQGFSDAAQNIVRLSSDPNFSAGPAAVGLAKTNAIISQALGFDVKVGDPATVAALKNEEQTIKNYFAELYGGRGFTDAEGKLVGESIGGAGQTVDGNIAYANAMISANNRAQALREAASTYLDGDKLNYFGKEFTGLAKTIREQYPLVVGIPTVKSIGEISKYPVGITVKFNGRNITNNGQFSAEGVTGREIQ
jgi:hypothetical protein